MSSPTTVNTSEGTAPHRLSPPVIALDGMDREGTARSDHRRVWFAGFQARCTPAPPSGSGGTHARVHVQQDRAVGKDLQREPVGVWIIVPPCRRLVATGPPPSIGHTEPARLRDDPSEGAWYRSLIASIAPASGSSEVKLCHSSAST
jgi:hypothetical protein